MASRASSRPDVSQTAIGSLFGDLDQIAAQYGMGGGPGVTLELGRTRHLDILIIANDVDHAIGARHLGAFLKIDQGRQERGVACFDIVSTARARFAVRCNIPQVGDDRRSRLLAEEKLNRPVGFFTSLGRFQSRFDRQQIFIVPGLGGPDDGERYRQPKG